MTEARPRGFTLIELVVTLFVLTLAATVVGPSVVSGMEALKARTEAAGLATFLRGAREQGGTHKQGYEVRGERGEGNVGLREGNTVPATRKLGTGVRVTVDPPARAITFLPQGFSSGARLRLELGRRVYLVTVDPLTGRVSTARVDA